MFHSQKAMWKEIKPSGSATMMWVVFFLIITWYPSIHIQPNSTLFQTVLSFPEILTLDSCWENSTLAGQHSGIAVSTNASQQEGVQNPANPGPASKSSQVRSVRATAAAQDWPQTTILFYNANKKLLFQRRRPEQELPSYWSILLLLLVGQVTREGKDRKWRTTHTHTSFMKIVWVFGRGEERWPSTSKMRETWIFIWRLMKN